jgi:hypothetical protein
LLVGMNSVDIVVDVFECSEGYRREILEVLIIISRRGVHEDVSDLLLSSGQEGGQLSHRIIVP